MEGQLEANTKESRAVFLVALAVLFAGCADRPTEPEPIGADGLYPSLSAHQGLHVWEKVVELEPLTGDSTTHGEAINGHGHVVGFSGGRFSGGRLAVWRDGKPSELRKPSEVESIMPFSLTINDDDEVFAVGDTGGDRWAVSWGSDGSVQDVSELPRILGARTSPWGHVMGRARAPDLGIEDEDIDQSGFIWTREDGITLFLPTHRDDRVSSVLATTPESDLVLGSSGGEVAVLWRDGEPEFVTPGGWARHPDQVRGMSEAGEVLIYGTIDELEVLVYSAPDREVRALPHPEDDLERLYIGEAISPGGVVVVSYDRSTSPSRFIGVWKGDEFRRVHNTPGGRVVRGVSDNADVLFTRGVVTPDFLTAEEAAEETLHFFDEAVEDGTLEGAGRAGEQRLQNVRRHLSDARSHIDGNDAEGGVCSRLERAKSEAEDVAGGPAVGDLMLRIVGIMSKLSC